jgi:hypothetical protein
VQFIIYAKSTISNQQKSPLMQDQVSQMNKSQPPTKTEIAHEVIEVISERESSRKLDN